MQQPLRVSGRAAVQEFLGDRIVYRNLAPADERLPPLSSIYDELGLSRLSIPRKSELDYARIVALLLAKAKAVDESRSKIERLIFLGDTRLNDGNAFINLCRAGGWQGMAFIGAETNAPASVEILPVIGGGALYLANRWAALPDFEKACESKGLFFDQNTAVVVDLDKTAIGARGRNDHVIDKARIQAVRDTVAVFLGPAFDPNAFLNAYERLNKVEFHTFTADNQDYLAYICLVIESGVIALEQLVEEVRQGHIESFHQFIALIESRRADLPEGLREIHQEIFANVQTGDPTPFKAFRRNEYFSTVSRMGYLQDNLPASALLADEIVITGEVREIGLKWLAQGSLLFGLSDKPDEASFPTASLAERGYLPIHQTQTHVIGVE